MPGKDQVFIAYLRNWVCIFALPLAFSVCMTKHALPFLAYSRNADTRELTLFFHVVVTQSCIGCERRWSNHLIMKVLKLE